MNASIGSGNPVSLSIKQNCRVWMLSAANIIRCRVYRQFRGRFSWGALFIVSRRPVGLYAHASNVENGGRTIGRWVFVCVRGVRLARCPANILAQFTCSISKTIKQTLFSKRELSFRTRQGKKCATERLMFWGREKVCEQFYTLGPCNFLACN